MRLSATRMAEISSFGLKSRIFVLRHIFYVALFLIFSLPLQSQINTNSSTGKKKIELIHADEDIIVIDPQTGKDIHRFLGNVSIRHNDITMICDSAHFSPDRNQITAFSRIHIEQGDSLDLTGNYLFYDGRTEIAQVKRNVELIDKETHLYTDAINYDVKNRIARYNESGIITNAENTLTSIIGVYYVKNNIFHFKDSVKVVNPDYVMTADTMDYNTKTEIAFFSGPSELNGDSLYLYCEKGWFDTKNDVTSITKNAIIDNREQVVHGDSIYFDDKTGFGKSYGNVIIEDTTNNIIVKGNYAWYYKISERFMITDRAVFIQVSGTDSLFLHADTINAVTITASLSNSYRLMRAYNGCRIFSTDLQARCDSLSYSFQDSVIRLYRSPVLWTEENQLTSDSMAIFTKNRQTDRLELYNSAFVASQIDSLSFNQIKGKTLTGLFTNNELYKIEIKGNGESIYFIPDGDSFAGISTSKCSNIEVLLKDGAIAVVTDYGAPEGFIDPPARSVPLMLKLTGFSWLDTLRPKNKDDIFIK